jgi:hypothetical protein
MTFEATVNYYGVRRFGDKHYEEHFERLPMERKLRLLLLLCEGQEVPRDSGLVKRASTLANRRNALVHPKTRETSEDSTADQRAGRPCVEQASEAIADCDACLDAFFALTPMAADIDPRRHPR